MVTDTTMSTAAAKLSTGERLGYAQGCRDTERDAESVRERRFWSALADALDNPGRAADDALRAAAADVSPITRDAIAQTFREFRDISNPRIADVYNEAMCVLAEARDHEKRIMRETWRDFFPPTETPC